MKSLKIFLFLSLVFHFEIYSGNQFNFAILYNNTPYVIINNEHVLNNLEKLLVRSFMNKKTFGGDLISLDINHPEIIRIPHEFDMYCFNDYKHFPLKGTLDNKKEIMGFIPGEELVIEDVTKDGNLKQRKIIIEKVYYHSVSCNANANISNIILKCLPSLPDTIWDSNYRKPFYCPYITTKFRDFHPNISYNKLNDNIPRSVLTKIDSIEFAFFPKGIKNYSYPKSTQQKLRFTKWSPKNMRYIEDYYYAVVMSNGEKGRIGIFYILNSEGKIIQRIKEKDNYNMIIGITDSNRDGSHELILAYGSNYGGGVEIYYPSYDNQKKSLKYKKDNSIGTFAS